MAVKFLYFNELSRKMLSEKKILIVDDEPDICFILNGNFSKRGFRTSFTQTLAEAEIQLEANTPSVLLLDNHLPDGKGIDVVNKIKSQYPHLKIIMITAHDSPQDRLKAFSNGIDFFISKPFTISGINQAVDFILEN